MITLDMVKAVRQYPNGIVVEYRDGGRDWFEGDHPELVAMLQDFIQVPEESADKE